MSEIIKRTTVVEIVATRDAALSQARVAAELRARADEAGKLAGSLQQQASNGRDFHLAQHDRQEAYRAIFGKIDVEASVEAFRRHLDAATWVYLLDLAGIRELMDRTAVEAFHDDLRNDPPAVTLESVAQILSDLFSDRELIFQRSIARIFSGLDRRFRSHDGWKIGSRIILTRLFNEWGSWSFHNEAPAQITDCERIFMVLDQQQGDPGSLVRAIDAARYSRTRVMEPMQTTLSTRYFRIRIYKNGNAHLWFERPDLVEKVNQILADYYGAVLADGVPRETTVEDLVGTALARDLAFYPSPAAVAAELVRVAEPGDGQRVLEPSAGTGALVRAILARSAGATIHAIEVDPGRADLLAYLARSEPRVTVQRANFLALPPNPVYDLVVMNPPFHGTHWIDHVVRAMDWLRPGGLLVSVVPASAETGETERHEHFRAWAEEHRSGWHALYKDLPAESFAESGTRVQTSILVLRSPR